MKILPDSFSVDTSCQQMSPPQRSFRFAYFRVVIGRTVIALVLFSLSIASVEAQPATDTNLPAPLSYKADWRWVKGAVFVPTKYVNEAQQWDEYDPVINDRELHYASVYGFNCVRVYLHYYIYLKKKDTLLRNIEDFLTRADKYGIRTEFVFFDDCWNQPEDAMLSPDYKYPAPIFGVHNSRWLVSPGEEVRKHYAENRDRLKAYVQDIVNAHKDDKRIAFWETYNEPGQSPETKQLLKDSYAWIHETGTTIPITATGREFAGEPYSDFKSWHEYGGYNYTGTPDELNTECMNRREQTIPGIVEHFKDKTGFIVWEFGIGRDNCRFTWDENRDHPRQDETPKPFHGVVYPDGHPWSVDDVKALLGPAGFANAPLFAVEYYKDANFAALAKKSVTPMIDFDLGTERGTGSPDASAGVPEQNFSARWTGTILPPTNGTYVFYVDGDNQVKLYVNSKLMVNKKTPERAEISKNIRLAGGKPAKVKIEYVHATSDPNLHVAWSGPGFEKTILTPVKAAHTP
ncbi:MAG: PA14 domain-containing protein [Limisphaerales bacterium]